jgi:flagellin
MALSITNNISSLIAQQNLSNTTSALNTSLQRLSSGLKINTGADGPAALVISNEQGAQIAGLKSAIDNTNQAVSLVQTGEGALATVNDLLVQIRGLALSAANSAVNDPTALAADQAQIKNALQTIDRISANTQFGTKKLLDGTSAAQVTIGATGATNFSSVTAGANTVAGTYQIAVTQQGLKGQLEGASSYASAHNTATTTVGTALAASATISNTTTQTGTYNITVTQQGLRGQITGSNNVAAPTAAGGTLAISGGSIAGTGITVTFGNTEASTDIVGKVNAALAGSGYTASVSSGKLSIIEDKFASEAAGLSVTGNATGLAEAGFTGSETASQVGQAIQVQVGGGGLTTPLSSGFAVSGALNDTFTIGSGVANGLAFQVKSTGTQSAAVGSTASVAVTGDSSLTLGSGTSAVTINLNYQNAGGTSAAAALANAVATINQYTTTTGVSASANGGLLALTATKFGGGNFAFATSGTATGITTGQSFVQNAQDLQAKVYDANGNQLGGLITATGAAGDTIVANGTSFGNANGLSFQLAGLGTLNGVTGTQTAAVPASGLYTGSVTIADSLVFQIGANQNQTASLSIQKTSADQLGKNVSGLTNSNTDSLSKIDVTTASGAQDALAIVDQAINDISSLRGKLGAFQTNTLQATAGNLQTTLTNTTSAQSVIRDTDFAAETANFTKSQVLVQAGTTVLANANATAQLVLTLLK